MDRNETAGWEIGTDRQGRLNAYSLSCFSFIFSLYVYTLRALLSFIPSLAYTPSLGLVCMRLLMDWIYIHQNILIIHSNYLNPHPRQPMAILNLLGHNIDTHHSTHPRKRPRLVCLVQEPMGESFSALLYHNPTDVTISSEKIPRYLTCCTWRNGNLIT